MCRACAWATATEVGDVNERLRSIRTSYDRGELIESAVDPDPIAQFQTWLADALRIDAHEPNAMTLATVDAAGGPNARVVLLRGVDARGFVFYTNYESCKGRELAALPRAVLVFWWPELERQVRIRGDVALVSAEESDAYFATRPRGHKLGACVSAQSAAIAGRAVLEARLAELERAYPGEAVPRPPHWGGYRVTPDEIEFWQGRTNRLHDRLVYRRAAGAWRIERLSP